MKCIAAFDIGGTNARFALADSKGRILTRQNRPTRDVSGKDIPGMITEAIQEMMKGLRRPKLAAIGGSHAGICDSRKGIVVHSPNIKDAKNIDLKKGLRGFKVPFRLLNDGNAAALGVYKLDPKAKGMKNIIYVVMGSGIGGGIIIGGRLYTGFHGFASEIGHSIVADEAGCSCGRKGHWEAYSSGWAIARTAKRSMYQYDKGVLRNIKEITSKDVFDAAAKGDILAKKIVEDISHYNSVAVANLITIFDPEAIFFGESILKNEGQILDPIKKQVPDMLMDGLEMPRIVKTSVAEPGLRGAVYLALSKGL